MIGRIHLFLVAAALSGSIPLAVAQEPSRESPRARPGAPRRQAAVPDGVRFIADIAYREGHEKWRLDLATPKERSDKPAAGLVFVHGGGWRGGDKGGGQWRSLPIRYAEKGYVAISVNYRLTGDAPFPACVEDVKCAVRWFRAHAREYNVDPDRIGAYGNSAGAHLVSLLGLAGRDAGLEGDGPFKEFSSAFQAVCASATPTDFLNWAEDKKQGPPRVLAGPEESYEERAKKGSPITYVRADAPPFLLVHGTADTTVPIAQSERFVKALREAGSDRVTYMILDNEGHGVFNRQSVLTHPAMEAFFDTTIGERRNEVAGTRRPAGGNRRRSPGANTWARMDRDGDGKIARDEARGQLKANFDRVDLDDDGVLDRSELEALAKRLRERRGGGERRQRGRGDDRDETRKDEAEPKGGDGTP